MYSIQENYLQVPGASLYYQIQGSGPVLLMMPGGISDASSYASIAPGLADKYTVVTYDPRGLSHSKIDVVPEGQQLVEIFADDAHRLLAAVGNEPAFVFGNSGGALLGLALATRYPQQVRTLVAHEPPAIPLLPDGPALLTAMQEVHNTYRRAGVFPAMQQFLALAGPPGNPAPQSHHEPEPAITEARTRMQQNLEFFLDPYLMAVSSYHPDLPALLSNSSRIVVGVGDASTGQLAYRGGMALAEQLGKEVVVFPGAHGGYSTHPDAFAAILHQALKAE